MDNNKPVSKAKVVSRKACLADFLEDTEITKQNRQNEHTKNHDSIQKNQREYGQRKRIKP